MPYITGSGFSDLTIEKIFLHERMPTDLAVRDYEYRRATGFGFEKSNLLFLHLTKLLKW